MKIEVDIYMGIAVMFFTCCYLLSVLTYLERFGKLYQAMNP